MKYKLAPVFFIVCVAAAIIAYKSRGATTLCWVAAGIAGLNLGSYRIMRAYRDVRESPQPWATINFLTTAASIGVLIYVVVA